MDLLAMALTMLPLVANDGVASPAVRTATPEIMTIVEIDQENGHVSLAQDYVVFISPTAPPTANTPAPKPVRARTYRTQTVPIDVVSADFFDVTGTELSAEQFWAKAKDGDVVAVSGDGLPLDPMFAKALAAETLVIVSGHLVANHGGERNHGGWPAYPLQPPVVYPQPTPAAAYAPPTVAPYPTTTTPTIPVADDAQ